MRGTLVATNKTQAAVNELEAYFARKEMQTAPAWRPDPGETIIGEVVGLRMGDGDHGPYPIIVVRTETGPRSMHAFHTLLRDSLREIGVKKGMRIAATYEGMVVKNDAKDKAEKDLEQTDQYHMYFVADLDKVTDETEEDFTL